MEGERESAQVSDRATERPSEREREKNTYLQKSPAHVRFKYAAIASECIDWPHALTG